MKDAIKLSAEGMAFASGMVIGTVAGSLFLRWVWFKTEKR